MAGLDPHMWSHSPELQGRLGHGTIHLLLGSVKAIAHNKRGITAREAGAVGDDRYFETLDPKYNPLARHG